MENVYLYNRPLRLSARSSNKDFNNNPNEPYTPEMYVSDSSLHRQSSWHSPQQQQPPPIPQQSLPIPLFSNNDVDYPPQPQYSYDDRAPPAQPQRFERRKHNYHPYNRNEQDYQNTKQRSGNYNHQRRGGGGYNNNYYR